jgi:PAS domain S-box-containing protein
MPRIERKIIENLKPEELIFKLDPPAKKPGTVKEKLRASEIRYRRVFEAAKDGILILDAVTLKITDANPFMTELLGYRHSEFLGKQLWEIGLFRDKAASKAAFHELQLTGYLRYEDLPLESRSGVKREVEFVSNVYDEDGRSVIQCNIRDITERRMEEAIRERLAAIVKSSDDAIISKDLNGIITTWNSAAEKMFGYLKEEIVGKPVALIVPPNRHAEESTILARVLRGESVYHFETARIRKDGTAIDVAVTISPIRDDDGKIIGASKIARDISELKRAIRDIRDLNAELEQRVVDRTAQLEAANRELEAFSYSVSHDLRAPLRHINGFSGALLEDYGDSLDDIGKDYLRQVREASQEMAHLIDDVLQLSRVTRTEMMPEAVDLSKMARSVMKDIRKADPRSHANVQIKTGMTALGDRRLLRILLTNLLGNAWKFTAKKQKAEIVFNEEKSDGKTVFCISDNGAGFDMAFADKLFGAFQRLHGSDEFEGTGIGLATVQRIISRHRGEVWGEGAVDVGAVFYFTLPGVREAEIEK